MVGCQRRDGVDTSGKLSLDKRQSGSTWGRLSLVRRVADLSPEPIIGLNKRRGNRVRIVARRLRP